MYQGLASALLMAKVLELAPLTSHMSEGDSQCTLAPSPPSAACLPSVDATASLGPTGCAYYPVPMYHHPHVHHATPSGMLSIRQILHECSSC